MIELETDFCVFSIGASVGTNVGDIGLWEVGSKEKLVSRNFKVWDLGACSMPLQVRFLSLLFLVVLFIFVLLECTKSLTNPGDDQAALVKDPGVSVNRIIWSPDGSLFGML